MSCQIKQIALFLAVVAAVRLPTTYAQAIRPAGCENYREDIAICRSLQDRCHMSRPRRICPITCDACTEDGFNFQWATCAPTAAPRVVSPSIPGFLYSCNGILDEGLCTRFNRSECCDTEGLLDACPGLCEVCPPTPAPTFAPSDIPTASPTSSPFGSPSLAPTGSPIGPLCSAPRMDIVIAVHSDTDLITSAVRNLVDDLVRLMPISDEEIRLGLVSNIGNSSTYSFDELDTKRTTLDIVAEAFNSQLANTQESLEDVTSAAEALLRARSVTPPPTYEPLDVPDCSRDAYEAESSSMFCFTVALGGSCGILHGTLVSQCPFACGECPTPVTPEPVTTSTTTASSNQTSTPTSTLTSKVSTSMTTTTMTTTSPTTTTTSPAPFSCLAVFEEHGPGAAEPEPDFCASLIVRCELQAGRDTCPWTCSGCDAPTAQPTTPPSSIPSLAPSVSPSYRSCWNEDDARFCRAPELNGNCSYEGLPPWCVAMCNNCGSRPPSTVPTVSPTLAPTTHCAPRESCSTSHSTASGVWNCATTRNLSRTCIDADLLSGRPTNQLNQDCSSYYVNDGIFCEATEFDDDDFTAATMCCACGGGVTATTGVVIGDIPRGDTGVVISDIPRGEELVPMELCFGYTNDENLQHNCSQPISCFFSNLVCDDDYSWPVCDTPVVSTSPPMSTSPTFFPSESPTPVPQPTLAPTFAPTDTPRCHGELDQPYCRFVPLSYCNESTSQPALSGDCKIHCGTCPITDAPTMAPSTVPTTSSPTPSDSPTASPTRPTCFGVPDYEFCDVLNSHWCVDDPRAVLACPLKCLACNETQPPSMSPTSFPTLDPQTSCNGERDPLFCFLEVFTGCGVEGLNRSCLGHCNVCPPTPEPTGVPTVDPTALPSLQPTTTSPSTPPTFVPSESPTTLEPTGNPSGVPSGAPITASPTTLPTAQPSALPTALPTSLPSGMPTSFPSGLPSRVPTFTSPTHFPSTSPTFYPTPYRTCVNDEAVPLFRGVVRKCSCSPDCHTCEHDGINAGKCIKCMNSRVLDPVQGDCFDERLCSIHTGRGNYNKVCIGTRYNSSVILVSAGEEEVDQFEQRRLRSYFQDLGAFVWHIHRSDSNIHPEPTLAPFTTKCIGKVSDAGQPCTCDDDCHECAHSGSAAGECTKCRNGAALLDGRCVPQPSCWDASQGYIVRGNGQFGLECVCGNNNTAFAAWMTGMGFNPNFGCSEIQGSFGCGDSRFQAAMQLYCKDTCGFC